MQIGNHNCMDKCEKSLNCRKIELNLYEKKARYFVGEVLFFFFFSRYGSEYDVFLFVFTSLFLCAIIKQVSY